MPTFFEAMEKVAEMAKKEKRVFYLYKFSFGYGASFRYWSDWLFKAYPGGRRVLSAQGRRLTSGCSRRLYVHTIETRR